MEDKLEAEEQIQTAHETRTQAAVELAGAGLGEAVAESSLSPAVQALIQRCMDGTEPLPDRKYWEQLKFNPQHVQVVMLRVAGFKQVEISRMIGLNQARISTTLSHPYSKKIIAALLPESATRVIDIRTRLETYAGDLLDHAYGLAMKSEELKDVREVTFGFLDRAGYNAVAKSVEVSATPGDFKAPHSVLSQLSDALGESQVVDAVVMPAWTPPKPPTEGARTPDLFDSVAQDESVGTPEAPTPPLRQPGQTAEGPAATESLRGARSA